MSERIFESAFSRVVVSGQHHGIFTIEWDWFEEEACCDSSPSFNGDFDHPAIEADCDCGGCEGFFRVELREIFPEESAP